jgi:lipoate-protein ligase A
MMSDRNQPYRLTIWRLITTPSAHGAWNMAVDEAILEHTCSEVVPPTLRLYAWDPACLSLGYAQTFEDADMPALKARGWDLVRRPTGGRAILHTDELTYAVIGPNSEPRLSGGVLESYQRLSRALLEALHRLEIPAKAQANPGSPANSRPQGPVCFEIPSHYEITMAGRKLIGSAQSRKMGGVLQHGSLPLYGDITRITQALKFENDDLRREAARRLADRAATVETVLGSRLSWEMVAESFQQSFSQTLNLDLRPSELSPSERSRTEELVREKYANPEWTRRK